MGVVADAGAMIRLHPADRPLPLQEMLELLAEREGAGAADAELAGLLGELASCGVVSCGDSPGVVA